MFLDFIVFYQVDSLHFIDFIYLNTSITLETRQIL